MRGDESSPILTENHDFRLEPAPCARIFFPMQSCKQGTHEDEKVQKGRNYSKQKNEKKQNQIMYESVKFRQVIRYLITQKAVGGNY